METYKWSHFKSLNEILQESLTRNECHPGNSRTNSGKAPICFNIRERRRKPSVLSLFHWSQLTEHQRDKDYEGVHMTFFFLIWANIHTLVKKDNSPELNVLFKVN